MSSIGFENIFKKYNISCEAPKKTKPPKPQKRIDKNYERNNNYCINLGRGACDASIAGNKAVKQSNSTLSSSIKVSQSAKELKTKKMWERIRAKRRYKPLDLITMDFTNAARSQNSVRSTDGGGVNDVGHLLNSSDESINMNFSNLEEDNINVNTQSPILSSSSNNQEKTNKTYLCQSKSLELKKKKRNLTPKYLYRHRQLPILNITANKQTSKEILTIQTPYPKGSNSLEISNSSTTSSSSLENTCNKSFQPFRRNLPKIFQSSSQGFIDQPTELDLKKLELVQNDNRKIAERTKHTNSQEISCTSTTVSSSSLENNKSYSSLRNSPKSQIIDTPTTASQESIDQPTELDLLLELIENDNRKIAERTKSNIQEISCLKKPRKKGGIEEHFLHVLNRNKIDGRYLKHDKKFGLRSGVPLRVIKLDAAYGITIATVQCLNNCNEFCTVIAPEMVAQVKIGSMIESFFDETCDPYSLQTNGKKLDLFLQPYKLLVL